MKLSCHFNVFLVNSSQSVWKKMAILILGMVCFTSSIAQTDSSAIKKQELILHGITQGPLPYLKYGPGVDRLGGGKMTYLDTAVILQVVDSLNSDYITAT